MKRRSLTEQQLERNRFTARRWGKLHADRKRETNRRSRARHADDRNARRRAVAALIAEIKAATPCADCGNKFDPVCMDFDHRPGETKLFGLAKHGDRPMSDVAREIAKCDVVCANCHRIRTHRKRDHHALARAPKPVTRQAELPLGGGR